jgi:hypothetical protein
VCRVWARVAMPSGTVQAREKAGKIADSHCSFPFALLLLLLLLSLSPHVLTRLMLLSLGGTRPRLPLPSLLALLVPRSSPLLCSLKPVKGRGPANGHGWGPEGSPTAAMAPARRWTRRRR